MAEHIPKNVKWTLCLFKGLQEKICNDICRLILLLWREFYIQVNVRVKIESMKIIIKKKDTVIEVKHIKKLEDVKDVLIHLVKHNTIDRKDIDKDEKRNS